MNTKLIFSKIKNDNIFYDDFSDFRDNNELDFGNKNIVVLYGPNGVGKSSLTKVLGSQEGSYEVNYNGKIHNEEDENLFHIIKDQINRNIIEGEADEFLIGDNIRREYQLKESIDEEFRNLFEKYFPDVLKTEFKITTKNSLLTDSIENGKLREYVSDLANRNSRGKKIDKNNFIKTVNSLKFREIPSYEEEKFQYLVNNYKNKKSIISKILDIGEKQISKNKNIKAIEEHDEAIRILEKFHYKEDCIVCDNDIDCTSLHKKKTKNRKIIFEALDDDTKEVLEEIIEELVGEDPFNIRNTLIEAIEKGNKALVRELQVEIYNYIKVFNCKIENVFAKCLKDTNLKEDVAEYNRMLDEDPKFEQEDIQLIEKIINENMRKKIHLRRDERNIKLYIDDTELTNTDREELHLSTGEQNFISLAFELLRAKRSDKEIIVLDDPISSFDSIYQNKIAFIIIKFLKNKKQIVLTHNIELIKLLEHQRKGCFNLYLFNNTYGEKNGFIEVNSNEKDILLYLDKLLDLFSNSIFDDIKDEKLFLISMIPFMRGYTKLIPSTEKEVKYDNLSKLMHGYEYEKVNITDIYHSLFGKGKFKTDYNISAQDIIELDIKDLETKNIIDDEKYPLLNRTLRHNLSYLYIRMILEKRLVDLYNIDTSNNPTLGAIIMLAFPYNCPETKEHRIFLNSKKTLLNEFNHFEGNMNIFQPAIDITNSALEDEIDSIIEFLSELERSKLSETIST